MHTKSSLLPLFSAFCLLLTGITLPTPLSADTRVSPIIKEVTVYRSGAKVSSVATVKLAAGKSEIIFENLSPYFNPNSLQVKIKGGATLIAAIFQVKTPGPAPENPLAPILRDSLTLLGDEFTRIRDEREVLGNEQTMIQKKMEQIGTTTDGPNSARTLTVTELRELSAFYRQRLLEIKNLLLTLTVRERKTNELYQRIQQDLQKIQPNTSNSTGEIVLKIEADAAQTAEITCTYLVTQAYWAPLYDLRSEGLGKPLRLVYKANVRNQSGFDWKGVKLQLSTANPLANNDRPILMPVFVDFRPVYAYQQQEMNRKDMNTYNMVQAPASSAPRDLARGAGGELEALADDILFQPGAPETGEDLIANFDLPKPQDILANGEDNIVTVDEQDIPADYEYHAVPKLECAVFLLAKITDYGRYNLLPGTANIFYQDTYVGQTLVNPNTVADTLLLSLGRDEQITVKRVQPKDFTERRKVFSNTIKETYTYEIALKNNKSVPVRIEILDQVPVSKQKDIVVELESRDGAEYNAEFGKLKWELEIPANQSKRVRFTYSVKYPKDKAVGTFKG
ncbi:MAG: DUF4139 domain-containing protein [Saprospiraceae bacterium]|nr:DUF4139 domain-containing protein [Saprospiraceae bacterium]